MTVPMIGQANATRIPLPSESVHCIVTSPPYWQLRVYTENSRLEIGNEALHDCNGWTRGEICGECYVCRLRLAAREMWRVLRPEGTLWLVLGDTYAGSSCGSNDYRPIDASLSQKGNKAKYLGQKPGTPAGLKPKDRGLIPFRVALALQADGWYLRSVMPWIKRSSMPGSQKDRPTATTEYVFLLTKNRFYFFDMLSIRRPTAPATFLRARNAVSPNHKYLSVYERPQTISKPRGRYEMVPAPYRAARESDWFFESLRAVLDGEEIVLHSGYSPDSMIAALINNEGYKGTHTAAFPLALVLPCIKAGSSEKGVCPQCGAPWTRTEEEDSWMPTCSCGVEDTIPSLVLDPFCGSGTVLVAAAQLRRRGIGFDLSLSYAIESYKRLELDKLALWMGI